MVTIGDGEATPHRFKVPLLAQQIKLVMANAQRASASILERTKFLAAHIQAGNDVNDM